ncbi:hypothetical protein CgunFtcFv8_005938 [Champsocephalus gunnari]|uniref:C-type natriuretic peptide n=1 Tax=Champsocephalus gunnari TaxID=52237 RepID=A0AAN8BZC2_CHAGU|nr:hypothetical protein CgunFtcFv8_005938 [Champsocephalus gunnari]
MAASSLCSLLPLLFLFLTVAVETRPSPERHEKQVLDSLFGSRLSALILAPPTSDLDPPTSDDITEGSSQGPAPSSSGLAERRQEVPRLFLDILQSKMRHGGRGRGRGRGGGGGGGGRGCFGMKMDRIGSISGLGC